MSCLEASACDQNVDICCQQVCTRHEATVIEWSTSCKRANFDELMRQSRHCEAQATTNRSVRQSLNPLPTKFYPKSIHDCQVGETGVCWTGGKLNHLHKGERGILCAHHLLFVICYEAILIYDSDSKFFCAESSHVGRVFVSSKWKFGCILGFCIIRKMKNIFVWYFCCFKV